MNIPAFKRYFSALLFVAALFLPGQALAAIETSVEPFTGEQTYTSKYTFADAQHNMHTISLIKKYKPVPGNQPLIETYFLLNFTLARGVMLGEAMDIQVTYNRINSLPLAPNDVSRYGYSSVPIYRTGHKELPPMTEAAIEKGEELVIQVHFEPKGRAIYHIPAETVKEWAELLKLPEAAKPPVPATTAQNSENKETAPVK